MAIILICLPLADSLNSLKLISITTGLVVIVLMVDVYGSTSVHDDFWKCTRQCKYSAECPLRRKLVREALKKGTTIKLTEVRAGEDGEKGLYDVGCRLVAKSIAPADSYTANMNFPNLRTSSVDHEQ